MKWCLTISIEKSFFFPFFLPHFSYTDVRQIIIIMIYNNKENGKKSVFNIQNNNDNPSIHWMTLYSQKVKKKEIFEVPISLLPVFVCQFKRFIYMTLNRLKNIFCSKNIFNLNFPLKKSLSNTLECIEYRKKST